MSSASEAVSVAPVDPDAVEFESHLKISPGRVQKLARRMIGAYHLVPEPIRDVQLALKGLGVADEVVFRKLEENTLYLSPQPGVPVARFNEILVELHKALADRSPWIRGLVIGVTCAALVVGVYLVKTKLWP